MEERSNSSSSKTAREETDDWRTRLTPQVRRKVLDTILGSLKMSSSDPDAQTLLTKVVEQFEENVFHQARTKEDYARTISRKLKSINKPVHQNAGVSSSNPVDKQQQQESQHFLKHKVHQPNNGVIHVGDSHNNHDHQQQQRIVSQSSPLCSQNQALPTESQKPPFSGQLSSAAFHQNQLVSQEYNVEQKASPFWKSMPNSIQQPVGLQSNASCLRQQHRMIGPQLKAVKLKSHEHSAHTLQVEDTTLLPKVEQRVQTVDNFYHHLDSQNQRTQEAISQRLETLTFLNPRNVNNQQKVFPSQKGLAEVSSASSAPTAPSYKANMDEFHDRAYQKLQIMKKNYVPSLAYLYDILNKKCQKSLTPEIVGNYKKKISQAEKLIKVLSMPRENLVLSSMEKLESFEQAVKLFLNSFNQRNSASVQPPGGPFQISQLQQQINGQSPSSLTQPVVLSSRPNMMNSPCSGSLMKLKQQNAPISLDHAPRPEGHDIAGTQRNNFTHDATVMSFGSATKSLHQNPIINTFNRKKKVKHQMRQPQNVKQIIQSQMLQQHMQMANTQPVTASASLLCTESASPIGKQQSSATKNPLERLLKAVQSISTQALSASVSEISLAMKTVDGVPGTVCNDSEADVGENLDGRNFSSQYGCSFEGKMKHKHNISAMAPDTFSFSLREANNLRQSTGQICDVNSSETSRIKRRRIEPSNTLLDEIKYINQRLLETVIDLDSTEDIAVFDHGEGTIVRCTYNAMAFSEEFKKLYASQMSVRPLRLLVPASYPNASPVVLDTINLDSSCENNESIDISEKTILRFSLSVRKLSEPISLTKMAMTWDACARAVLWEYAQSVGGGCFISRYGKWEKCSLTA
ncbi:Mediator of RNA polymerase II transcription subunit 15a [Melia azedarach]|uniref:Mediator of RNA polymerase II transcription subunit 15a n=1 Tax=Melia azedarach TaxID=155640 RepID=A0ACC1X7R2_MELAZ|nr:Mediator of RNA polymerase II transcription subunit 15a [Melia azedarach]